MRVRSPIRVGSHGWVVGLLVGAAAATACGAGDPVRGAVTSVDSAGVEIITIGPPDLAGKAWATAPSPDLEIGLTSGSEPYLLDRVRGAVRLGDSRVVVADGGSKELRFFDSDGRYLFTVGREGEGPGEFNYLDLLAVFAGDSIMVFDRGLQRASVFDSAGDFIDSWRVAVAGAPPLLSGAGVSAAGTLAMFAWIGADPEAEGPYTAPEVVGLFSRANGEFQVIDTIRSSEESQVERGGRLLRAFRPFGRKSDIAVSGDAVFVLDALAERSVHVYSSGGDLVRILRFDIPRVAATGNRVAGWTESFMTRHSGGSVPVQDFWRYGFERTPPVDSIPLFRSLEADEDGNLCAERYPLTETEARVYWCFSERGAFVRSITVDGGIVRSAHPHLEPQVEIGRDYVLGVWMNDLGVEQVRSYRLVEAELR